MSLKYGFAELQALASDIRSNEGKLRETHDELQGYVQGLVAQWESGAQQNYQAVQAKWDGAHNDRNGQESERCWCFQGSRESGS